MQASGTIRKTHLHAGPATCDLLDLHVSLSRVEVFMSSDIYQTNWTRRSNLLRGHENTMDRIVKSPKFY